MTMIREAPLATVREVRSPVNPARKQKALRRVRAR